MKRKTAWGVAGIFALAALVWGIWNFFGKPEDPAQVKVVVVKPTSLQEAVHTSGTVKPERTQEIRTVNPARVVKVAVKTGDSVQAGTTLIELDPTLADSQIAQAQAAVEAAKANRNLAQANLDAVKAGSGGAGSFQAAQAASPRLTQGTDFAVAPGGTQPLPAAPDSQDVAVGQAGAATVKQAEMAVVQADAALKQAQAGLKAAQAQRSQLSLKSAISGTVLEVNVQEGNLAPVQAPLAVIGDLSKLYVELNLNEVDATRVQSGQKAEISRRQFGQKTLGGTVAEIAPQAVITQGLQTNPTPAVKVKVVPEQASVVLKPGFSVDVDILVAAKDNVLAIPQEALFQEQNKSYVYRVEAGKARKTEVNLGIADDVNQEILNGLKAGDQVVLNPTDRFYEGMPVQVQAGSEGG